MGAMKLLSVADAASKPNPHGVEAKTLYDHDHALISHLSIQPGQALKKHVTPVDVAFYVLEGRGEVEIGEEKETVTRDTIVESPMGIPHLLRNTGDEPFRLLVMKLPRPTEKSKIL
jgi:mannose-6-phosphate isomerase-like protein (cupin superfamily)